MDTNMQTQSDGSTPEGGSYLAVVVVIIIILLGGIYFWYMRSVEKARMEENKTSEAAMTDEALQKDLEASGSIDIESDLQGLDEVYR